MGYRAPVSDIVFTMSDVIERLAPGEGAQDVAFATSLMGEAGRFAEAVLLPLNRVGDTSGAIWREDEVVTAPGWKEAYAQWCAGGWNAVTADPDYGGMGLSNLLNAGCQEIWCAANLAFSLCPLLTMGAIEAVGRHASEPLKATYLAKLVSGRWTGTMNLTEPQSGSDLSGLRTRAEPQSDGSYRIFGSKCFITYGEHDLSENIIHLVLARLPDAPDGSRGISLFLVPKFPVQPDGMLGARNDLRCSGVERKLGIHASPTCSMVYGEGPGALGYLVGEPNRGLACMFTMMNNARLGVGLEGVAIAERAYQQALAYANDRRQGRAAAGDGAGMSAIILHPDIRRMLLTMKALTQAARTICYVTAAAIDLSQRASTPAARRAASERAGLLTPIAKAFSTDIGNEVASLGIQVHGGMGFIEDTGAAQLFRDARIMPIYEGTNGIQAIDLVQRKLPLGGGGAVRREMAGMAATLASLCESQSAGFGQMAPCLGRALDALERSTAFLISRLEQNPAVALAGATAYLRLFGLVRGGTALAEAALAAERRIQAGDNDPQHAGRVTTARFFAENLAVAADGLAASIAAGSGWLEDSEMALAS
jgi:acyl-CoA dehydrogenase